MNKKKKSYKKGGKVPQYFLGGSLKKMLGPAAGIATSFIPGVGPAIAPMVAGAVGSLTAEEQGQQQPQLTQALNTSATSYGKANGGAINWMGQNALAFNGASHEGGGIQIPGAEVEGGETMDFVELRNGGVYKTNDGSPYVFSKRLKVPETNTSFADTHKQLVKNNASEDEIKQLALAQEKMTGRDKQGVESDQEMYTGGDPNVPSSWNPRTRQFNVRGNNPFANYSMQFKERLTKPNPIINGPNSRTYRPQPKVTFKGGQGSLQNTVNSPAARKALTTTPSFGQKAGSVLKTGAGALGKLGGGAASILATPETLGDASLSGQGNQIDYGQFLPQSEGIGVLQNQPNNQPYDPLTGEGNPLTLPEISQGDPRNGAATSYDKQPSYDRPSAPNTAPQDVIMDQPVELGENSSFGPIISKQEVSTASVLTPENNMPTQATQSAQTPEALPRGMNSPGQEQRQEQGVSSGVSSALQFLPDAMNFLTGAFGEADTPDPTQVSNRSVDMIETDVNVNPALLRNAQAYRSIISDPNASPNQKLAAQAQKMQADSAIFADQSNRENQLKANQASLQANLDSQNAQFSNQARTERMQGDAMFGPTGNMARQAIGSGAQKLLMQQAQRNQKRQNDVGAMAVISQLDPALQKRFMKDLGI